jgi:hypothetical protein
MTTEVTGNHIPAHATGPLALKSNEGLGDFFTATMLKSAVMSELAEARARRGYCPKCQAQSLRHCYSGGGMVYRQCAECGTVAVLVA